MYSLENAEIYAPIPEMTGPGLGQVKYARAADGGIFHLVVYECTCCGRFNWTVTNEPANRRWTGITATAVDAVRAVEIAWLWVSGRKN